jgi:hypothetical protein
MILSWEMDSRNARTLTRSKETKQWLQWISASPSGRFIKYKFLIDKLNTLLSKQYGFWLKARHVSEYFCFQVKWSSVV